MFRPRWGCRAWSSAIIRTTAVDKSTSIRLFFLIVRNIQKETPTSEHVDAHSQAPDDDDQLSISINKESSHVCI